MAIDRNCCYSFHRRDCVVLESGGATHELKSKDSTRCVDCGREHVVDQPCPKRVARAVVTGVLVHREDSYPHSSHHLSPADKAWLTEHEETYYPVVAIEAHLAELFRAQTRYGM